MAGHSKWAGIKHKKAIVDARRGKLFTKLARAITVAAKDGGGDPEGNPALALAIQKAKDASMPKDNIERAIAKGTGEGADAERFEEVVYEGYGPGGVALLIEALTDNRNRTGSDVRHLLSKHGGNLGEPGSVAYLFEKKGVIVVDADAHGEDDLIVAIDAGRQDIAARRGRLRGPHRARRPRGGARGARAGGHRVRVRRGHAAAEDARARSTRTTAAKLMRLIDALDDNDDVGEVHANFEADAEVLERVAAGLSARSIPAVLREEPRYRLLFAGQTLSVVGDRIAFIALAFAVLAIGDLGDLGIVDRRGGRCRSCSSRCPAARSATASAAAR